MLVKDGACGKLLALERPTVDGDLILLKVEAGECVRRENVAVVGKSAREVEGVVIIAIVFAGSYYELRVHTASELSYKYFRGHIGRILCLEEIACDKNVIYLSLTHKLHHS